MGSRKISLEPPASDRIFSAVPVATSRSPRISSATTYGSAESLVKILPFSRIKSGGDCWLGNSEARRVKASGPSRILVIIRGIGPPRIGVILLHSTEGDHDSGSIQVAQFSGLSFDTSLLMRSLGPDASHVTNLAPNHTITKSAAKIKIGKIFSDLCFKQRKLGSV